jgi:hypothetical protein
MINSPAAFRPFPSSWPRNFSTFRAFIRVQLASFTPFFVGCCCCNFIGLGISAAGFVVVGVEVGGKFVEVLMVQNLCKFNRKNSGRDAESELI